MTTITLHPAAAAYLGRLRRAARPLPRDAQRELLSDIEAHLHEAIDGEMSEAEVLSTLDRLGSPEEIVAAQLSDAVGSSNATKGTHEWAAIILLLLGGFAIGIGWLIGLILLWSSRAWTTVDKLIGTLVIPGGLASVLLVAVLAASKEICSGGPGQPTRCTGGPSTAHHVLQIALVAIFVLAPIATAIYLSRRARPPARATE
jgi:uncharacterized membrane protein